jgi:Tol biopolymer transport system component
MRIANDFPMNFRNACFAVFFLFPTLAFAASLEDAYDVRKFGPYDELQQIRYSPDGQHYAFLARKDGKQAIVRDGIETESYDSVGEFRFSPDNRGFALSAEKNGKSIVVRDGIELPDAESEFLGSYSSFAYSPDGKGFAFTAWKNGRWILVKDGAEIPGYNNIGAFAYAPR